jgi:hypothetical protein
LDIWIFHKALAQRLTLWAWASITLGALCFLPEDDFWGGLAFQFLGWALISLAIAGFDYLGARSRLANLTAAEKKAFAPAETDNMITLLQGCIGLSVVCMLGGQALAFFMQVRGNFWIGTGMGITLQGTFMFFFSRYLFHKLG